MLRRYLPLKVLLHWLLKQKNKLIGFVHDVFGPDVLGVIVGRIAQDI